MTPFCSAASATWAHRCTLLYALAKRPDIDGLTLVSEDMHYGGLNYVQG